MDEILSFHSTPTEEEIRQIHEIGVVLDMGE